MDRPDDAFAGDVEWLDAGRALPPDGHRRRRPRWSWWYPVAALALTGLVVVAVHKQDGTPQAARPNPTPNPTAPTTTAAAGPVSLPPAATTPALVTVVDAGRALLDVPPTWELFGRGPGAVVRIQLAAGRVTTTTVPDLASTGQVWFIAVLGETIVRPPGTVAGYLVRDSQTAQPLAAPFDQGGPVFPGPDPDHVWVETESGVQSTLNLVGLDGRSSGVSIPVPPGTGAALPDGTGYPLLVGTGGVYDARPGGTQRVTTGTLLAVGPTRWLTVECDPRYRCATTVIDRASGARRVLPTPIGSYQPNDGLISPDGRTAALLGPQRNGISSIYLLDLATGAAQHTRVSIDLYTVGGSGTFVWSPDSRFLFAADGNGAPAVIERATGSLTRLDVSGPALVQLDVRIDGG